MSTGKHYDSQVMNSAIEMFQEASQLLNMANSELLDSYTGLEYDVRRKFSKIEVKDTSNLLDKSHEIVDASSQAISNIESLETITLETGFSNQVINNLNSNSNEVNLEEIAKKLYNLAKENMLNLINSSNLTEEELAECMKFLEEGNYNAILMIIQISIDTKNLNEVDSKLKELDNQINNLTAQWQVVADNLMWAIDENAYNEAVSIEAQLKQQVDQLKQQSQELSYQRRQIQIDKTNCENELGWLRYNYAYEASKNITLEDQVITNSKEAYKYMSDEDRNAYNWIYLNEGETKAINFLEALQKQSLDKKYGYDLACQDFERILNHETTIGQVFQTFTDSTGKGIVSSLENMADYITHDVDFSVNEYRMMAFSEILTQTEQGSNLVSENDLATYYQNGLITEQTYQKLSQQAKTDNIQLWDVLLESGSMTEQEINICKQFNEQGISDEAINIANNVGLAFGNMVPSIAVSLVTTGAGISTLAPALGNMVMFTSSAGGTLKENLRSGYTLSQSYTAATISGVSEIATGYFLGGIPGLSKVDNLLTANLDDNLLKSFGKYMLSTFVVNPLKEMGEEGLQLYLGAGIDSVVKGETIDIENLNNQLLDTLIVAALTSCVANTTTNGIGLTIKAGSKIINFTNSELASYIKPNEINSEAFMNDLDKKVNNENVSNEEKTEEIEIIFPPMKSINSWEWNYFNENFTFLNTIEEVVEAIKNGKLATSALENIKNTLEPTNSPKNRFESIYIPQLANSNKKLIYVDDSHNVALTNKKLLFSSIINPNFFNKYKTEILTAYTDMILNPENNYAEIPKILFSDELFEKLLLKENASYDFKDIDLTEEQIKKLQEKFIKVNLIKDGKRMQISTDKAFRYYTPERLKTVNEIRIDLKDLTKENFKNLSFLPNNATIIFESPDFNNEICLMTEYERISLIKEKLDILDKLDKPFKTLIKIDKRSVFNNIFQNLEYKNLSIEIETLVDRSTYQLEEYIKSEKQLDKLVANIKNANLSPFEKYMAVYNIVKDFKPYKENYQDSLQSRQIKYILNNEYIVCAGYANLLCELLDRVGINSTTASISVDTSYDYGFTLEEKVVEESGHRRVIVNMDDSKYNIHGLYIADPTWDSGFYLNHALMPYDKMQISGRMFFYNDTYDVTLDIHNFQEFNDQVNFLLKREIKKNQANNYSKKSFHEILLNSYNKVCLKIINSIKCDPQFQSFNTMLSTCNIEQDYTNFLTEIGDYLLTRINQDILKDTIINASMEGLKQTRSDLTDEQLQAIFLKKHEIYDRGESIKFPYQISEENDPKLDKKSEVKKVEPVLKTMADNQQTSKTKSDIIAKLEQIELKIKQIDLEIQKLNISNENLDTETKNKLINLENVKNSLKLQQQQLQIDKQNQENVTDDLSSLFTVNKDFMQEVINRIKVSRMQGLKPMKSSQVVKHINEIFNITKNSEIVNCGIDSFKCNRFFTDLIRRNTGFKSIKKFLESLSDEIKTAVNDYTSTLYEQINYYFLRRYNGNIENSTETLWYSGVDLKRKKVDTVYALDKLLSTYTLEKDMIAYRYVDMEMFKSLGITSVNDLQKLNIGNLIQPDFGFISTTPLINKGLNIHDILLILHLPKNLHVSYIDPIAHFQGENEMLVQRNCLFHYLGCETINMNGREKQCVYVEVEAMTDAIKEKIIDANKQN